MGNYSGVKATTAYVDSRGVYHRTEELARTANWGYKKGEAVYKFEKEIERIVTQNIYEGGCDSRFPFDTYKWNELLRFIKDNPVRFRVILDAYILDSDSTQ